MDLFCVFAWVWEWRHTDITSFHFYKLESQCGCSQETRYSACSFEMQTTKEVWSPSQSQNRKIWVTSAGQCEPFRSAVQCIRTLQLSVWIHVPGVTLRFTFSGNPIRILPFSTPLLRSTHSAGAFYSDCFRGGNTHVYTDTHTLSDRLSFRIFHFVISLSFVFRPGTSVQWAAGMDWCDFLPPRQVFASAASSMFLGATFSKWPARGWFRRRTGWTVWSGKCKRESRDRDFNTEDFCLFVCFFLLLVGNETNIFCLSCKWWRSGERACSSLSSASPLRARSRLRALRKVSTCVLLELFACFLH